ncbi:MAG: urate hydroxylase PuuD [Myxococcaceae bacterium]
MDPIVADLLNLVLRWIHVVAGILWIGHLYFFNFVNAQLAKSYDADSKAKVVPQLMPRALYWFRWGSFFTWVTGVLLIGIVYHVGKLMVDYGTTQRPGIAAGVGFAFILFGFFLYDVLWKVLGKNELVAGIISFLLLAGLSYLFHQLMSGRAAYIHLGSVLGATMMMNVWMRIWPAQKKIIRGIRGEQPAPDASVAAAAALRSKHNVYMSIPLTFFMVSNHYPIVYSTPEPGFNTHGFIHSLIIIAVGFGVAKFLFVKSASDAPTKA